MPLEKKRCTNLDFNKGDTRTIMIITFEGTNYLREGTFVDYLLNSNILLMYVFSMSHAFVMYVYLRANFSVCAKRRVVSCVQII